MSLRVVPVKHAEANEFVRKLHRHSRPTVGAIYCVAVADDSGLRGVAIVGRPVARMLDDCGWNLLYLLLAIASVPVVMSLSVLTWMLWNMMRGKGGWK